MTEEKKKKRSIFGPNPFRDRSESRKFGPRGEPFSPFGKRLTPEERRLKKLRAANNRRILKSIIDSGTYDRVTSLISQVILAVLGMTLARFYLRRYRMFNFMVVGATGCIVNWLIFNLFRLFIPIEFIAFLFAVLITFLWNYIWNEAWTFKYKNIQRKEEND